MPSYAYRCRACDADFEITRSMSSAVTDTACPQGHRETSRVWTPVAVAAGAASAPAPAAPAAGGGCCGGGCCG